MVALVGIATLCADTYLSHGSNLHPTNATSADGQKMQLRPHGRDNTKTLRFNSRLKHGANHRTIDMRPPVVY